jgi:hypothetical protein
MARIVNRTVSYKCDICDGVSESNSNWKAISVISKTVGSIDQISLMPKKYDICSQCKESSSEQALNKIKSMIV